MSRERREDDHELASRFASEPPTGACPSENQMSALLSGTVLPEERAQLDAHLLGCSACREVVAVLGAAARTTGTPASRPRQRVLASMVAATVPLFVGLALLGGWLRSRAPAPSDPLAECAALLERARPDLFAGFRPLVADELAPPEVSVFRGGELVLIAPRANILETRPLFRWWAAPGLAQAFVTVLERDTGAAIWESVIVATAPWEAQYPASKPELERGVHYQWQVTMRGTLDESVQVYGSFAVADPTQSDRFAAALAVIDSHVERPLSLLVKAHLAARASLLVEAERYATAYQQARPGDAAGRALADHLRVPIAGE